MIISKINVGIDTSPVFIRYSFSVFQAASVLHEMYKKFPVLYNSSIVSSFEPKVIYKVTKK